MKAGVDTCTTCGGEVEEVLRGGDDTAVVNVRAGVCLHCGERFYDLPTTYKLDEIQLKLRRHETHGFKPIGRSYEVA